MGHVHCFVVIQSCFKCFPWEFKTFCSWFCNISTIYCLIFKIGAAHSLKEVNACLVWLRCTLGHQNVCHKFFSAIFDLQLICIQVLKRHLFSCNELSDHIQGYSLKLLPKYQNDHGGVEGLFLHNKGALVKDIFSAGMAPWCWVQGLISNSRGLILHPAGLGISLTYDSIFFFFNISWPHCKLHNNSRI